MIQDIYPAIFDNQYHPEKTVSADSFVLCFDGRNLLCSSEGGILALPRYGDMPSAAPELYTYLLTSDEEEFFLYTGEEKAVISGFEYQNIRVYEKTGPAARCFAAATGYHLSVWYSSSKYCGCCGEKLVHDGRERMMRCPKCGNMVFPRINPCIIAGVMHNDRILCTRYNRPGASGFSLVAGFCEIGETLEETVRREVMEEVGLKVKNITFFKSQPWALSQSLLAGFICEAETDDFKADGTELESARWYTRDELKQCYTPSPVSLTSHIVTSFMNGELGQKDCRKK